MKVLLKSRKFEVISRAVASSEGGTHRHDFIVHPGAVVILPLLDADQCIMIRNYRPSVDRELWELPAGTLDVPGECPERAAARELEEETGYRAGRLAPLCKFYSSPGFLTELLHAFVASDLTETRQRLEPTEHICVETTRVVDALAMVRDGRIIDAKTLVTLLRWDMQRRESA